MERNTIQQRSVIVKKLLKNCEHGIAKIRKLRRIFGRNNVPKLLFYLTANRITEKFESAGSVIDMKYI